MINLATDKHLQIFLSNNNKALAEAIKQATPEQLALMKESKDIKGLLASLTNEGLQNAKSDRVLLEILKNNPTFKSMGSFPDDLKSLASALKNDKQFAPLGQKLELFFKSVATLDAPALQKQIINSGVFLESKIAADANPKAVVRQLLGELLPLLKASNLPEARPLQRQVAVLLADEKLVSPKNDTATLQRIADTVLKIVKPLQNAVVKSDSLFSKEAAALLDKLQT